MKKTYTPTADMRTNPLSKTEGGSTITVEFSSHNVEYKNIKFVNAYIKKLVRENEKFIVAIYVGGTKVYPNSSN